MKEREAFRYWRACFSELQNTTYTEGTVLYFRKTKSEEHIVSDLFGYTGPTASDQCVRVFPPFRTKILSMAFKQWRSSAMEMS